MAAKTKKQQEEEAAAAAAAATATDPNAAPDPALNPDPAETGVSEAEAEKQAKAAAKSSGGKAKTVELKDKETGFFDSVTGFQVVRDQQVKLGTTIGESTREAIASGRLLYVEG